MFWALPAVLRLQLIRHLVATHSRFLEPRCHSAKARGINSFISTIVSTSVARNPMIAVKTAYTAVPSSPQRGNLKTGRMKRVPAFDRMRNAGSQSNVRTRLLVREVLTRAAPSELPLFELYDPSKDATGKTAAGALGWGSETVILLLLPVAYKFFDKLLDAFAKDTVTGLKDLIKKVMSRNKDEPDANLESLAKATTVELVHLGLSKSKAENVAVTFVRVIVQHRDIIISSVDKQQ
jgi:hypothetical protein